MPSKNLNIPNLMTFARVVAIPVILGLMMAPLSLGVWPHWLAMVLFTLAAITDYLDGYLARKWGETSLLGQLMDPIADKLLVAGVVIVLLATSTLNGLEILAALIIIGREIAVSGVREFLSTRGASLPVTQLAKWKTVIQMVALGFLIVGPHGPDWVYPIGLVLLWIATVLTIITGFAYLKKAVSLLKS